MREIGLESGSQSRPGYTPRRLDDTGRFDRSKQAERSQSGRRAPRAEGRGVDWLGGMKARHNGSAMITPDESVPLLFCYPCNTPWPCEKFLLISHIEEMRKENADLSFRVHWAKVYMECSYCLEADYNKFCPVHERTDILTAPIAPAR